MARVLLLSTQRGALRQQDIQSQEQHGNPYRSKSIGGYLSRYPATNALGKSGSIAHPTIVFTITLLIGEVEHNGKGNLVCPLRSR